MNREYAHSMSQIIWTLGLSEDHVDSFQDLLDATYSTILDINESIDAQDSLMDRLQLAKGQEAKRFGISQPLVFQAANIFMHTPVKKRRPR